MTPDQKIELASIIENYINSVTEDPKVSPKHIGHTNRKIGINGFKVAEVGTPVFDSGDRYFITIESLSGSRSLELGYHKHDLLPLIEFI